VFWNLFRREREQRPAPTRQAGREGETHPEQDTRAVIDELSRVVKGNPEAVEIYLALGSLYRSQGDIERAIRIRKNLIVRPDLDEKLKARAWFELGRDFRRGGFLDRAAQAFEQAHAILGDTEEVLLEMARLAAQASDFARAAELYARLGRPLAEAHYLVRQAGERLREFDIAQGQKLLRRALKVHPASVEAWLGLTVQALRDNSLVDLAQTLAQGLDQVEEGLAFLLLDGLIESALSAAAQRAPHGPPALDPKLARAVLPVIEARRPDVLSCYYGARLLLLCNDEAAARTWFEKALVLSPNFWLARLELFTLAKAEQTMTPFFSEQLDFFIAQARRLKRFVCRRCGLKRDGVFFVCPRCRSWHSITFRMEFTP
jgi:lipopolysaccharide biosynthesis regulator YciM